MLTNDHHFRKEGSVYESIECEPSTSEMAETRSLKASTRGEIQGVLAGYSQEEMTTGKWQGLHCKLRARISVWVPYLCAMKKIFWDLNGLTGSRESGWSALENVDKSAYYVRSKAWYDTHRTTFSSTYSTCSSGVCKPIVQWPLALSLFIGINVPYIGDIPLSHTCLGRTPFRLGLGDESRHARYQIPWDQPR